MRLRGWGGRMRRQGREGAVEMRPFSAANQLLVIRITERYTKFERTFELAIRLSRLWEVLLRQCGFLDGGHALRPSTRLHRRPGLTGV